MSCSICYETFINPKDYTREEFEELFKEKMFTHNEDKLTRFTALITSPFKCNTPACEKLYCDYCYIKIKQSNPEEYGGVRKKDTFLCQK